MNAKTYTPGNRFSDRLSIAQACVELLGLRPEQQELVVVDGGLPFLAGMPDLGDLAEALLDAAQRGKLTGSIFTEDGYPLRAEAVRLDRHSVLAFMPQSAASAATWEAAPQADGRLLGVTEAADYVGISRSQFYRELKAGNIEPAQDGDNKRWRVSYLSTYKKGAGGA